jgi:hypothetical protein
LVGLQREVLSLPPPLSKTGSLSPVHTCGGGGLYKVFWEKL